MKKAPGFAASQKAETARALGMAMGERFRQERLRQKRHIVALWVAVAVTFLVALFT